MDAPRYLAVTGGGERIELIELIDSLDSLD